MSRLPQSWREVLDRFAWLICDEETAREWIRQALEAQWGVLSPADLDRGRRGLALQRCSGVLLALEDFDGDLAFAAGQRQEIAAAFARYFGGVLLDGPPWRCSPVEMDRPTREEYLDVGF